MKTVINLILLLLWMTVIFYFSSLTGSESSEQSQFILSLFSILGIDMESSLGNVIHILIRKGAHMFEYFVLTLLVFHFFKDFVKNTKIYILTIMFTFLYACSDEIHQYYVPLRGGRFTDVLIDVTGGMFALSFIYLYKGRKKKKQISN